MRTRAFLKNGIIILAAKMFTYLMEFLSQTVFIYTLSIDYVGVKGLFTNILSILSLTELGIGSVLIYSMYKPLAEGDKDKLLALTAFYKKAYLAIACLVGGIGLVLTPLLPYLIKDCPEIDGLHVIYLLYLANSVLSYLFTYKLSLFQADQKLYICTFWNCVFSTLKNIAQIICLFLSGNFFLFLLVQLPFTLLNNLFLSRKAEKQYPFLKTKESPSLSKEEKVHLMKNTFAMFNHRIGATILNSTDNVIISRFVGLKAAAINYNYTLVTKMITQIMSQIFSTLTASVGNLNVTESPEASYRVFKILHFASFWFYSFCTISLFILLNPFIELVFGKEYLFSVPVVAIICLNFYIVGIREIPLVFKESMGLLWQDRFKPLIEAGLNLIISIIAVHCSGTAGVFIGTFISMVSTSLWVEPYVLFKYGFKMSWRNFWLNNARYFLTFLMMTALTCFAGSLYDGQLIAEFIYRLVICIFLPNLLLIVLFHRQAEFKDLLSSISIKNLFHKNRGAG